MTLHAIILESPSDFGEAPDLIVAETHDDSVRGLVRLLAERDRNLTGGLERFICTYKPWLPANPIPDPDGQHDLDAYLSDLHEVLDGFWWTFYTIDGTTVELAS
jgi:hypothetical protein